MSRPSTPNKGLQQERPLRPSLNTCRLPVPGQDFTVIRRCLCCGVPEATADKDVGVVSAATVRLKNCAACLHAHYCSARCQRKDWARHREQCAVLVEIKRLAAARNTNTNTKSDGVEGEEEEEGEAKEKKKRADAARVMVALGRWFRESAKLIHRLASRAHDARLAANDRHIASMTAVLLETTYRGFGHEEEDGACHQDFVIERCTVMSASEAGRVLGPQAAGAIEEVARRPKGDAEEEVILVLVAARPKGDEGARVMRVLPVAKLRDRALYAAISLDGYVAALNAGAADMCSAGAYGA